MLKGNQLQKAIVGAGIRKEPKQKRRKDKKFNCVKCGQEMVKPVDTNIMYCSNPKCNNYYIFQ